MIDERTRADPRTGGVAAGRDPIRVLATVVVPPHMSVSGGARAAEQLSAALAPNCAMTVASMMNGRGIGEQSPRAENFTRLPVRTWLPPLLPWSRLPQRYSTLFYRSNLPELVAAVAPDLVHIHNPMPALEMARVARACQARGIPYVVSTHGFNEVANGGAVYGFDPLRRQIWQRLVVEPVSRVVAGAAAVFALSPADEPILRDMGFARSPVMVPNGVPLPPPGDSLADEALLGPLGIGPPVEGQLTCMFLANHTPNKGLPVLLEAFGRLDRPFLLVIGGETRPGVDYAAAIAACRPGQRIIVTGRLEDAAVAALFRRADLFVFPTLADTFPLAVLEAMAHGVPVLASRVGGIPYQLGAAGDPATDATAEGDCGVLVPPGKAGALSAALAALAVDPARLVAMGQRARARVADIFTWDHAAAEAMKGYCQVLSGDRVPAGKVA